MNAAPPLSLWNDLWADLQDPRLLWQIGVLLVCVLAGWWLARSLRQRFARRDASLPWSSTNFVYVFAPFFTLILILIAKPVLAQWQHVHLLRIAVPLSASFALIRLAFYLMRRVFASNGKVGNLLALFEKVFAVLVWSGVALYITGLWPELIQYVEDITVPLGRGKVSLLTILQGALSVSLTLLLALWTGTLLEERLMALDSLHSSLRVVIGRLGRAILILVAVLLSLSLVGIDLTVLSVFGGALGVGLGLGLQKIVSSYVSGFVVLFERSVTIGDMVAVDKFYGKVTQINTRYTVLQGLDGIETVIPNEMLVSLPMQNYALSDPVLRLSTAVSVGYETDLNALFALLTSAVAAVPRVLADPEPHALLLKFGSDGLDLEIGFWIQDPENGRLSVLSDVNLAIWQVLKTHNIRVPYPHREIRILGDTPS